MKFGVYHFFRFEKLTQVRKFKVRSIFKDPIRTEKNEAM